MDQSAGRNKPHRSMAMNGKLWILPLLAFFFALSVFGPADGFSKENAYPLVKLTDTTDCYEASLEYPVFGQAALDQSVRGWAEQFFAQETADLRSACAEGGRNPDSRKWEFGASPQVTAFNKVTSIEFSIYYDTGGAHPNHEARTLILNEEGKILGYADLFGKPEGLWKFFSEYAFSALRPEMKKNDCWNPSTVREGLAPKADSFKHVVVTPQGLTLIFPPYQVAAYACGEQRCHVPLAALAKFSPRPGIWDSPAPAPRSETPATPSLSEKQAQLDADLRERLAQTRRQAADLMGDDPPPPPPATQTQSPPPAGQPQSPDGLREVTFVKNPQKIALQGGLWVFTSATGESLRFNASTQAGSTLFKLCAAEQYTCTIKARVDKDNTLQQLLDLQSDSPLAGAGRP